MVEFEQFFDNFAGNPPTPSSLDDETWSGPKSAGFLGYVVLEEFSLPVAVSASLQSEGIELSWNDFGANYRYTVERSDSLEEGTWRPIEGYQWPINGTTWSFNSGGESAGFFRVRAELE